jgi:hypothetical protein
MKQLFRKKFTWIFTLAIAALVVVPFMAFADNLQGDDLNTNGNTTKTPGQTGTAKFYLVSNGNDGCNVDASHSATVTVSSNQSWLTIDSPGSVSLTACSSGNYATIGYTVSGTAPIGGIATISGVASGGKSGNNGYNNNPGDFTVTVIQPTVTDSTPPLIVPNISGTPGSNGWYISDVTVSWTVTDNESAISSATGCDTTTISTDTAGTTLTCSATSAGGTSSQSVTIKRDATGPSASLAVTAGTPGANGWYTSDVTVHTSGGDISSVTCTADQFQTTETAGTVFNGSCTNDAGLTTNAASVTVKLDKTGPSANLAVTAGTAGTNGWYISDVTVSTSGSDSISGPVACTADQFQTSETAGTVFTGTCTNDAGLSTAAAQLTVKRDATAPAAVTGTADRVPDHNGWYTSPVNVNFTGLDATSGIASCTSPSYSGPDDATATVQGSCTDNAGNIGHGSFSFKYDASGPSAALAVTAGTAGTNGWYTSDVTVSTSGSDDVSGPVTCTAPQSQTTETAGAAFNGSCTNDAGLTTNAAPLTVKLDKTGPSVSLAAVGLLGNNGWYVSDVTVSTSGSDSISSPVTCTGPQSQTTDTTGNIFTGSCTNNAGLTTTATPLTVKRDTVAPAVSLVGGPTDGGSYYFGSVPAAPTCSASDATSGLDGACSVSGYSTTVGAHTVTASAKDLAGNMNSASASYSVLAWTLKGFYQPVDMNGIVNTVKNGSTVPMKFEVFAGTTELTDVSAIKSTTYTAVSCSTAPTDDVELTATGGTSLRYDATSGQFIFNWQTPKTAGACLRATVTTQDGSRIYADFKLK